MAKNITNVKNSFNGRLFGPGISEAGAAASGHWEGDALILTVGQTQLKIPASNLEMTATGFNLQHIQLSWQSLDGDAKGKFNFFLEQMDEREKLSAHAPELLRPVLNTIKKDQRAVKHQFHAALALYGMILALPFILLAVFFLNTDRLAAWAASKIPVAYEAKIAPIILAQTRLQTKLLESGPAVDAVKLIGNKLTAGSAYQYRWFIAQNKEVNAFAAPGGIVVVYSGLIQQTSSPEELAAVLAHEVAHVEQRHSLQGLIKKAGFSLLLALVMGDVSASAIGGWVTSLTELKFSRDAEIQADSEGLRRMVAAKIAPYAMADFFAKLADKEGKANSLPLLASHPSSKKRMRAVKEQIAAMPPKQYQALNIDWVKVQASLAGKTR